ncbi:unnamed protein product [Malus baccata var. baccata]
MAYKTRLSFFALISVSVILLDLVGGAVAGRNVPAISNKDEKKQPQWLLDHDGSLLIPGIGRVMLPPLKHFAPFPGMGGTGSTGGSGSGGSPSSNNYVPGGDDTFVPNPGNEVPTPGNGGGSTPSTPVIPNP